MSREGTTSYDLLYVIPNKYAENELPPIMKTINDLIVKNNGKVLKEINYGKRRLAFPVKHNHYGYYILDRFEMEAKGSFALNQTLRVQDEVLRHLITHTLPEGSVPEEADLKQVETPVQAPQAQAPRDAMPRKRATIADAEATTEEKEKMKKGSTFNLEKELGITAKEAEAALDADAKKKEEETPRVDIKELDNKLDEIMKDFE